MKNILYAIVAFLIGAFCVHAGMQERSEITRLQKIGERVQVETPEGYTEHTRNGRKTYTADFTFQTKAGVEVKKGKSFPEELIADFENDTPVYLFYDPSSPSEFVFEKEKPEWFLLLFGVAFMIGGVWYAFQKPKPAAED